MTKRLSARRANPFRITGTVTRTDFTDREPEVARILRAIEEPGAKLLVYGPRRMGKTSAITVAMEAARDAGHHVIFADFSTASSVADLSSRVLTAALRALGHGIGDTLRKMMTQLAAGVTLSLDPVTGLPTVALDVQQRSAPVGTQRDTFGHVFDAIESMAASRQQRVTVILDEFQEIHKFGGETAEWHLRGTIQHHQQVSYVLAGSRQGLILEMLGPNRAFYQMLEYLHVGAIPAEHFAKWIDHRFRAAGVKPEGIGARVVAAAGPRSRDIVQLARAAFEMTAPRTQVAEGDVERALEATVAELAEMLRGEWEHLTALQQNILRALAAGYTKPFIGATRTAFSLGDSSGVSAALDVLVRAELVVKPEKRGGDYTFDSPFLRAWVVSNALPDLGRGAAP